MSEITKELRTNGSVMFKILSYLGGALALAISVMTYFFVSQASQDRMTAVIDSRVGCNETNVRNLQEQRKEMLNTLETVKTSVQGMAADMRELTVRQEAANKFLDERFGEMRKQLDRLEKK